MQGFSKPEVVKDVEGPQKQLLYCILVRQASLTCQMCFLLVELRRGWSNSTTIYDQLSQSTSEHLELSSREGLIEIPSKELTYPTFGKGKSFSQLPFLRDMLYVSFRECSHRSLMIKHGFDLHQQYVWHVWP